MKRAATRAVSALLSLCCALIACSRENGVADKLVQDLGQAVGHLGDNDELRIEAINKGEWNRMFVFPPYTPVSVIENRTSASVSSDIERSRISERDDINLLVFLNDKAVQTVAAVPRDMVEISVPNDSQPLTRSTAVFRRAAGEKRLILSSGR